MTALAGIMDSRSIGRIGAVPPEELPPAEIRPSSGYAATDRNYRRRTASANTERLFISAFR
jgi:hypothetical protein